MTLRRVIEEFFLEVEEKVRNTPLTSGSCVAVYDRDASIYAHSRARTVKKFPSASSRSSFFFFLLENKFIKFEVARLGNEYRRLFCYGCIYKNAAFALYTHVSYIIMF